MSTETEPPEDSGVAWDQLWDVQDGVCHELDKRIEKAAAGRSDQFGAALVSHLIEHLGEQLRGYLNLPESDVRAPEDGDEH